MFVVLEWCICGVGFWVVVGLWRCGVVSYTFWLIDHLICLWVVGILCFEFEVGC